MASPSAATASCKQLSVAGTGLFRIEHKTPATSASPKSDSPIVSVATRTLIAASSSAAAPAAATPSASAIDEKKVVPRAEEETPGSELLSLPELVYNEAFTDPLTRRLAELEVKNITIHNIKFFYDLIGEEKAALASTTGIDGIFFSNIPKSKYCFGDNIQLFIDIRKREVRLYIKLNPSQLHQGGEKKFSVALGIVFPLDNTCPQLDWDARLSSKDGINLEGLIADGRFQNSLKHHAIGQIKDFSRKPFQGKGGKLKVVLYSKYCKDGDLFRYFAKVLFRKLYRDPANPPSRKAVLIAHLPAFLGAAEGVAFIHTQKILAPDGKSDEAATHADVKPPNFLVDQNPFRVRLIDFSSVNKRNDKHLFGTPCYFSPQMWDYFLPAEISPSIPKDSGIEAGEKGPHVDNWALGHIMCEYYSGKAPYWSDLLTSISEFVNLYKHYRYKEKASFTPTTSHKIEEPLILLAKEILALDIAFLTHLHLAPAEDDAKIDDKWAHFDSLTQELSLTADVLKKFFANKANQALFSAVSLTLKNFLNAVMPKIGEIWLALHKQKPITKIETIEDLCRALLAPSIARRPTSAATVEYLKSLKKVARPVSA